MKRVVAILLVTICSLALIGCSNSGGMSEVVTGLTSEPIVQSLTSSLGVTTEQAIGGIGSILHVAQENFTPEQFGQLTAAIPNSDKFVDALDPLGINKHHIEDINSLQRAFSELGMDSATAPKFVPAVADFAGKAGGETVKSMISNLGK